MINRQAVAFTSAKIPLTEKLLASALENLAFYTESSSRLAKSLSDLKQQHTFAVNYCDKYSEDYKKVQLANDIAKKIQRLQAQMRAKQDELDSAMKSLEKENERANQ